MGRLAERGHELTPRPDEADVIVVNTCTFIDPAKQESIDTILEMAEYKKFGRAQRLVVAGCMVERYRGEIKEQLPEVDALIGTNELDGIVAACEGIEAAAAPLIPYLYSDETPRVFTTPKHFAYMKIAEGCDHPCAFCTIPQYRGAFRSRRFESVVAEATRLFGQGVREVNLIGQDTTCYGEDLRMKDGLADLLARLAQIETAQEKWIRFLYAYPNRVTQKLLDTIAQYPALVKYIDMPLQHASANVLKRMKRGASADIFLKLLERVRATIPGVSVRTSFIVGYPGETEADFATLCQFVEAAKFDRLGVFSYSDEDSSQSYLLDGTLTNYEKARENIQRALKRGRAVQILYVYQEPLQAWSFVQAREATEGRRIEPDTFIRQYFEARLVVNRLKTEFGRAIEVDLLLKNNDGSHRSYQANIDQIDNHVTEKYDPQTLQQLLGRLSAD